MVYNTGVLTKLGYWIPQVIIITALCGLVYLIGQQILRQSANDPQIQLSEDIASVLANGKPPQAYTPDNRIDISKSLNTFSMVFDASGNLIVSGAQVDGHAPILPKGVINATSQKGQSRVTWEPKNGVRIAAVITRYTGKNNGFVLVGRSLREVERREDQLLMLVGIAWIVTCLASSLATIVLLPTYKKH